MLRFKTKLTQALLKDLAEASEGSFDPDDIVGVGTQVEVIVTAIPDDQPGTTNDAPPDVVGDGTRPPGPKP